MFWIRLCLGNCSVAFTVTLYLCTASDTFRIMTYSVCAGIFNHIQRYWGIFTQILTLLRHIQTYSGIFSTLCNPRIFTTFPYSEPWHILTRHIQNAAIGHDSSFFRHIQNLVQRLHGQKPGKLRVLEYSELFNNCVKTHIQNPVILTKIYEYSELWHV